MNLFRHYVRENNLDVTHSQEQFDQALEHVAIIRHKEIWALMPDP